MKYKAIVVGFALVLALESTALAGPESTIGGKKLSAENTHQVGAGWPGLFYNWWNAGKKNMDWAVGGEFLYGEWNGNRNTGGDFLGLGINAPLRWHVMQNQHPHSTTDLGIRFTPGIFIGGVPDADRFVFGIRGEVAAPVSIDVNERVNVITGAAIPLTLYFIEDLDPVVSIPLFVRMGVEVKANDRVTPFFLFEIGPNLWFGDDAFVGNDNVDLAFRIWAGASFGKGARNADVYTPDSNGEDDTVIDDGSEPQTL